MAEHGTKFVVLCTTVHKHIAVTKSASSFDIVYDMTKKKNDRNAPNMSKLSSYKKEHKTLIPPLAQLDNLKTISWFDDGMPSLIWAVLIRISRPDNWRDIFSEILQYIKKLDIQDDLRGVTLTEINGIPIAERKALITQIVNSAGSECLKPMLLLKELPSYQEWENVINLNAKDINWGQLAFAVGKTYNYQSQESTDIQWLDIMAEVSLKNKLILHSHIEELNQYPYLGDQRSVRPFIRSTYVALLSLRDDPWPAKFWDYVFKNTECLPQFDPEKIGEKYTDIAREDYERYDPMMSAIRLAVIDHFYDNCKTTSIDAKFELIFGITQYCIDNMCECILNRTSTMISGRITLRIIFEGFIILKFLMNEGNNDPSIWMKYRDYGVGQYSLILRKSTESGYFSSCIDEDVTRLIANEDKNSEYMKINLGQWGASDLRSMSIKVGEKDLYDSIYDYTSGFMHANWGSIREASLQKCMNPLHRFHNIPAWGLQLLPSVADEAFAIIDRIMGLVDDQYPGLEGKIKNYTDANNNDKTKNQ